MLDQKNLRIVALEGKLNKELLKSIELKTKIQELEKVVKNKVLGNDSLKDSKKAVIVSNSSGRTNVKLLRQAPRNYNNSEMDKGVLLALDKTVNWEKNLSKNLENEIDNLKDTMESQIIGLKTLERRLDKEVVGLKDMIKSGKSLITKNKLTNNISNIPSSFHDERALIEKKRAKRKAPAKKAPAKVTNLCNQFWEFLLFFQHLANQYQK